MKIDNITIHLKPDGLHCQHDNGASIVISLAQLVRWIRAQFRSAV